VPLSLSLSSALKVIATSLDWRIVGSKKEKKKRKRKGKEKGKGKDVIRDKVRKQKPKV